MDDAALLASLAPALAAAGVPLPAAPRIHSRGEPRIVVELGDDRLAFVARGAEGQAILARERLILVTLAGRLPVAIPRVLWIADDGGIDVRAGVPGLVDPAGLFRRACADVDFAATLGAEIGALLAALHDVAIDEALAAVLPQRVSWPDPSPTIRARLPRVIDDPPLLAAIDRALDRFDAFTESEENRRLVHSDVGLHNLAIDPRTGALVGIFDFAEAAHADRHWDFRHLLWPGVGRSTFDAAIDAYTAAGGPAIDHDHVVLFQAATACSYLAFRDGVAPETRWCGRTLAEDLAWTRAALAAIGEPVVAR